MELRLIAITILFFSLSYINGQFIENPLDYILNEKQSTLKKKFGVSQAKNEIHYGHSTKNISYRTTDFFDKSGNKIKTLGETFYHTEIISYWFDEHNNLIKKLVEEGEKNKELVSPNVTALFTGTPKGKFTYEYNSNNILIKMRHCFDGKCRDEIYYSGQDKNFSKIVFDNKNEILERVVNVQNDTVQVSTIIDSTGAVRQNIVKIYDRITHKLETQYYNNRGSDLLNIISFNENMQIKKTERFFIKDDKKDFICSNIYEYNKDGSLKWMLFQDENAHKPQKHIFEYYPSGLLKNVKYSNGNVPVEKKYSYTFYTEVE